MKTADESRLLRYAFLQTERERGLTLRAPRLDVCREREREQQRLIAEALAALREKRA